MNPIGIGIDLVEVGRIRDLIVKHGVRFKEKTFTAGEITYCDACADPAMHYAARFAAKEAAAKAIGTGLWAEGVDWKDFEITREASGKPILNLHGGAKRHAEAQGVTRFLVSLTHTRDLAQAQVILV
ncbi:holo-[acyl-carrier protein] synthase [Prosthecobacter fusiformis]|uniref:Holo-[acyl-carrier-protein] synthase n=1 Tax=Prosthecobacter fusiformis TaxID=48464 RepID=A0A4R7S3J2_9BACT|nr:holo-ACP synthase [Prosthecobacter fusiformis]TDU72960.1 holo-[acyl-carrier protein] synthase [Prosthecobacter fusiformis]